MENPKVEVTVRSWLSYDGYECEGKSYIRTEVKELVKQIAGREIVWVKGRNTFAGGTINDRFFASMIANYVENK